MSAEEPRPTRAVAAIVAAAVVVIAAVVIILTVGLVPLPDLPSLSDDPDPAVPGTIAYVHGTWEDACIAIVPAGGGDPRDVWCDDQPPEAVAFTPDGLLLVSGWFDPPIDARGPVILVIDPQTGEQVDDVSAERRGLDGWTSDRTRRDDGTVLRLDSREQGVAELRVGSRGEQAQTILRLEGPRDYEFMEAQWSPDGAWILAVDSRGRLIVVGADGTPDARLLVETDAEPWLATRAAWWLPDNTTYTVDPADLARD